jgi:hypothetical protein
VIVQRLTCSTKCDGRDWTAVLRCLWEVTVSAHAVLSVADQNPALRSTYRNSSDLLSSSVPLPSIPYGFSSGSFSSCLTYCLLRDSYPGFPSQPASSDPTPGVVMSIAPATLPGTLAPCNRTRQQLTASHFKICQSHPGVRARLHTFHSPVPYLFFTSKALQYPYAPLITINLEQSCAPTKYRRV